MEQYLKPTYFAESDDPEIQRLAKKIVGNKRGQSAAKALFNWVRDNVTWNVIKIIGARKVLKRKPMEAECMDKNFLFVALCRSIGIPARFLVLIGLIKTNNPKLKVEIPHVASEVYINGRWIVTDPSFSKKDKLYNLCLFGKPSWKSASQINRVPEISKEIVNSTNQAIKSHPVAQTLKKMLAEARKK